MPIAEAIAPVRAAMPTNGAQPAPRYSRVRVSNQAASPAKRSMLLGPKPMVAA
jgi:hypothetical protein